MNNNEGSKSSATNGNKRGVNTADLICNQQHIFTIEEKISLRHNSTREI